MKKWLSLVILVALFSGCNSSVQNSIENSSSDNVIYKGEKSMKSISYKVVKSSSTPYDQDEYMNGKAKNLIFHSDDNKEVEAFMSEYSKFTGKEAPTFDGVMIISTMGTKNTGGYSIGVDSVVDSGRYIDLTLQKSTPKEGAIVTQAFTNPYIIIHIPNTHKDINIIEK